MDESKSAANAAVALLACVFAVPAAFAGEPDAQVRTEVVRFPDLNLATTAGVDALYKRIHSAAERVCAVSGEPRLGAELASAKCTNGALAQAIEKVNLPSLTAFAVNR